MNRMYVYAAAILIILTTSCEQRKEKLIIGRWYFNSYEAAPGKSPNPIMSLQALRIEYTKDVYYITQRGKSVVDTIDYTFNASLTSYYRNEDGFEWSKDL